jgi:hypothetical protein
MFAIFWYNFIWLSETRIVCFVLETIQWGLAASWFEVRSLYGTKTKFLGGFISTIIYHETNCQNSTLVDILPLKCFPRKKNFTLIFICSFFLIVIMHLFLNKSEQKFYARKIPRIWRHFVEVSVFPLKNRINIVC